MAVLPMFSIIVTPTVFVESQNVFLISVRRKQELNNVADLFEH